MIRKILAAIAVTALIIVLSAHYGHSAGNLVQPVTELRAWNWEQTGDARGGVYKDDDAIRCEIIKTDGTGWHLQLYQRIRPLVSGRKYRLHFMAKADKPFPIDLSASSEDSGISEIGLSTQVLLTSQWSSYDYTFTAHDAGKIHDRAPYFLMGGQTGKIWIKDLTLQKI